MNRLWVRLALAFVAVTLFGVAAVAFLTDWSAGREFRQFLARQEVTAEGGLLDSLTSFYQRTGTWKGVDEVFASSPSSSPPGRGAGAMRGRPGYLLADGSGLVVYDERGTRVGSSMSSDERAGAAPVQDAGGRVVGYLFVAGGRGLDQMQQAEQSFLDQLRQTLVVAGVIAVGLGILMGLVMSRMIAAPLGNLVHAARAFARRDWDHRVPVKGTDEIAEVAREFNEMAESTLRAETLRRNLMADVAHELRTPLTVLQGNLRAMLDGVYPLELAEVATLYDQTRHLNRLVEDLRELALADAGQLPLNLRAVDAAEICRAAVADLEASASVQNIQMTVESASNTCTQVEADPDRLSQVLRNLLANSIRHTPSGGSITVRTKAGPANSVQIDVLDTGEGIAAEDLPHVFDRFYRADKSRTRERGGTGLGLAIAKAWVEAMGGTIGAESQQDHGSRFWFALPPGRM